MKPTILVVSALLLTGLALTPLAAAEPPLQCPIGGDVGQACSDLLQETVGAAVEITCTETGLLC